MATVYVDAGDDGARWVYHIRESDLKFCLRAIGKFASRKPIEAIPASTKERRFAEQLHRVKKHWADLLPTLRPEMIDRLQQVWNRPPEWFFEERNATYRVDVNTANQALTSMFTKRRRLVDHLNVIQELGRKACYIVASWSKLGRREKAVLGRLHILLEHAEDRLGTLEGADAEKYIGEALNGTRYGDLREHVERVYAAL